MTKNEYFYMYEDALKLKLSEKVFKKKNYELTQFFKEHWAENINIKTGEELATLAIIQLSIRKER